MPPLSTPSSLPLLPSSFFFFNDTAPPEIYTLSLHDALPISAGFLTQEAHDRLKAELDQLSGEGRIEIARKIEEAREDRKSTRLNSSHMSISYAVFCLKKKKKKKTQ